MSRQDGLNVKKWKIMHAASAGPHSVGFSTLLTLGDTLPEIFVSPLIDWPEFRNLGISEAWSCCRCGKGSLDDLS